MLEDGEDETKIAELDRNLKVASPNRHKHDTQKRQ